jgi:poly(A) polymerase
MTDGAWRLEPSQGAALAAVLAALPDARIVGGAVRDHLAGRPVADVDLGTALTPEAVTAALVAAGLRAVPTGLAHGTVTALSGGHGFEVTTLRRDIETDGRHAVVAFTDDWRADAARRDFTINAMSMSRDGVVYDYFSGRADLAAGVVRFVGDPATRIAEDALRILRFFRFRARFGRGAPDPAALAAIGGGLAGLASLSAERVWNELSRILTVQDPTAAVRLMERTGVLGAILPAGTDVAALARLVDAGAPADALLRLAALTGDASGAEPAALADRLRLSGQERAALTALRAGPPPSPDADGPALRRALADIPAAVLIGRAWLAGGGDPAWSVLRGRLAAMPRPEFPLEGRDVLALGLAEGPRVGALLRAVRGWWLDGGCVADAASCREELARQAAALL